jgi:hypothetical protein
METYTIHIDGTKGTAESPDPSLKMYVEKSMSMPPSTTYYPSSAPSNGNRLEATCEENDETVFSNISSDWGGVNTDLNIISGSATLINIKVTSGAATNSGYGGSSNPTSNIYFVNSTSIVSIMIPLEGMEATGSIASSTPFFILSHNNAMDDTSITSGMSAANRVHFKVNALCVPPFTKIPKIVEIKDVNRGDIIRTSRGDLPIAHIMKTQTGEHKEYVKFEKGCLAPNLPSDDFYVTEPHPLSLGFYKNEVLNNGEYDDKEDDYIMLQMAAGELVDTLPGITKVKRDFGHYYNLVFDEHASIDMEGIDVCSHHPRTGPFYLPRDKYIDNSKIDDKKIEKKITNPKFIRFNDLLIRHKPKDVELKEFLASCLTSNLNKKRQLMN